MPELMSRWVIASVDLRADPSRSELEINQAVKQLKSSPRDGSNGNTE